MVRIQRKRRASKKRVSRQPKRLSKKDFLRVKPLIRVVKFHNGNINDSLIDPAFVMCQCPFQDLPVQLSADGNDGPNRTQRLGAEIYCQQLHFNLKLTPADAWAGIQRFRVCVVRYIGEMDFSVDNSDSNGWEGFNDQGTHLCKPGQDWRDKNYMKN